MVSQRWKTQFRGRKMVLGRSGTTFRRRQVISGPPDSISRGPKVIFGGPKTLQGRRKTIFGRPKVVSGRSNVVPDRSKVVFDRSKVALGRRASRRRAAGCRPPRQGVERAHLPKRDITRSPPLPRPLRDLCVLCVLPVRHAKHTSPPAGRAGPPETPPSQSGLVDVGSRLVEEAARAGAHAPGGRMPPPRPPAR